MPKKTTAKAEKEEKPKRRRKPHAEDAVTVEVPEAEFIPEGLGVDMPDPHAFLSGVQSDGSVFGAADVYRDTWAWLKKQGCADFVSPQLVERYAVSYARWMQCEERTNSLGLLAKHATTGRPIASPFVEMGLDYMAQTEKLWSEITRIVKNHTSESDDWGDPEEDIMGRML